MILPDLLTTGLDIVFCGTAAGNKSAERKAYYARAGNLFYPTLAACGLTPKVLKPNEFPELLNYNIGLTDLAKHHFGMDKDLKSEYFDTKSFEDKIVNYQPKLVCFNGKEAAKIYFNLKKTSEVMYGLQAKTIGSTKLYVAPSTSLQAIAYWDDTLWQKLTEII
jgi:double-stranded uracil-DNA glycosylase